jgi:16S rRNA processing protein RimM
MSPLKQSTLSKNQNAGSPQSGEPVYLAIAKLRRTHGVKGEVVMDALTDFPERIQVGNEVFVGKKYNPYIIESIRQTNKNFLIKFEGFSNCEQATVLRNQLVYIRTEHASILPEGEFYQYKIIGMKVMDEEDTFLGEISEIIMTGANDVYVVKPENGPEILIPAIKSVVLDINPEKQKMTVKLPEWD